jgi:hypothetical protein
MFSLPCSSHHAPSSGQLAPARGSHVSTSGSHTPLCLPRAAAKSSSTNLLLPCPLLQLLLNGLFYCPFYFPCIANFLYFCIFSFILLFVLLFVGFYLPAKMWFDLEEEIVVGGRPSAPFWFSSFGSPLVLCSACFAIIIL